MIPVANLALVSVLFLSPPATPAVSKDKAVIAVADAYTAAMLKADSAAVAALYMDDAIEMPPNAAAVKGKTAIEQYYKKQFADGKITAFSLTHVDSHVSGDVGYDIGTYTQAMTPAGKTQSFQDAGKYIVVLKKSGGKWLVRYVCYNSDNPPPPAPPASATH